MSTCMSPHIRPRCTYDVNSPKVRPNVSNGSQPSLFLSVFGCWNPHLPANSLGATEGGARYHTHSMSSYGLGQRPYGKCRMITQNRRPAAGFHGGPRILRKEQS